MKARVILFCLLLIGICAPARATLVVVAPHPDDAEASCGGLIANTVASGEQVVIITMTGGELGVIGKGPDEAREIRRDEAEKAAATLGAKLVFFGAVDGSLTSDAANAEKLKEMIFGYDPQVVVAPWPIDVHPDHQASGLLAWRAFQDNRSKFELYFYETSNEPHTKTFQFLPTNYVDITDAMKKKQAALYCHQSQFPTGWFDMYKNIERFRGYEADVTFAEGYLQARNYSSLNGRPAVVGKTLSTRTNR
jgi:LmbE family N-acetylglucosaminyl deacetylase